MRSVSNPKIQRWLDLLATLLARRSPATFLDLSRDVPAYLTDGSVAGEAPSASLKRMFERDKLELRELGIPIISVGDAGDEETAYQLRSKDFYLPYLAIMAERRPGAGAVIGGVRRDVSIKPFTVRRYCYRRICTLCTCEDSLNLRAKQRHLGL